MDKSLITNLVALLIVIVGMSLDGPTGQLVLNTGLFALSGAITNWLAIHMLFERVPGFYGSGVIPARFEEFKHGIKTLVMDQFFNAENLETFFSRFADTGEADGTLDRIIDRVDLNAAFDSLVDVIMNSSFANMLSMFGGTKALESLREPFVARMREFLVQVAADQEILNQIRRESSVGLLAKVEQIVDARLEELTPQLVKDIIQKMIRQHLGWLVVWGGVIGGLIGLLTTVLFFQ